MLGDNRWSARVGVERRVIIDEVNTSQYYITGKDAYGTAIQVPFDFQGAITTIPAPGELWIIKQYQGEWRLDRKTDQGAQVSIQDMSPGDKKLEAAGTLYHAAKQEIVLASQDIVINAVDTVNLNAQAFFINGQAPVFAADLLAHTSLTTTAHGGIVASTDSRLTDQRVPTDGSVTNAKVAVGAAIVASKLAGYPSDATKYLAGDGTWPTLSAAAGSSGTLAAIPSAASAPNKFYYATDQDVLYFSDGSTWLRQGLPAGATTMFFSATAPTGWVIYDGGTLPASTGIYASLFTHLGTTTTPDTRGRMVVAKGTNVAVSTIGNTDGVAVANRRPQHKHSPHTHQIGGAPYVQSRTSGTFNPTPVGGGFDAASDSVDGGSGVSTDSLNAPAYIVFSLIAKL